MTNVTYIITVYNKEKYIADVVNSLKNITGNFRKEFIIIDDGSTDSSLKVIETAAKNLPKTIVIKQDNQGPAFTTNKALSLAQGDYIHFVDGDDVIASDATQSLLNACHNLGTEVAYGLRGKYDGLTLTPSKRESDDIILIDSPIKAILEGKVQGIRAIGSSGSLVSRNLLEKVSGADIGIFVQDLSISLRCAKYSKFAYFPKTVSYSPVIYDSNSLSHNKEFAAYNTLKTIANFMTSHTKLAEKFKPELYKALWSTIWKLNKYSLGNLPRYLLSKIINQNLSIEELQELYNGHIRKLL